MIYHFLGIGGIGMSGLARILLQQKVSVQGSDLKSSPLLEDLQKAGAKIFIGHAKEHVQNADCIVYSTDVKPTNVEWLEAKQKSLPFLHRSQLLDRLMSDKKPLLVTGTHGKTTTTALLSSVIREGGLNPSFVIGGIHQQWKTNAGWGEGPYFVAEADESDGSFLRTPAFGGIVTNLENDHLDYWKTKEALDQGFAQFFSQAQSGKHLFWCGDDLRLAQLHPKGFSYGFKKENAFQIHSLKMGAQGISFSLGDYKEIELNLMGEHNALNGSAVFALAISLGIQEEAIRKAFRTFSGTKRRLEYKGSFQGIEFYDDYGHHPTEIQVTLRALRAKAVNKRLLVVFQPHRFSRVRDLMEEFALAFANADQVILTDIFSAGEAPIEGVNTRVLEEKLKVNLGSKLHYIERSHLEEKLVERLQPEDVVLTIGAGDVTKVSEKILDLCKV